MTFVQSDAALPLSDFARAYKVKPTDLWLPFYLAPTAHSRPEEPIVVRDTNALALLTLHDGSLVYRRSEIAAALGMTTLDEPAVNVALSQVPNHCQLYIRWDRPGRKMIPARTPLLHRAVTHEEAVQQGIVASAKPARRGRKRTASVASSVTDAVPLAEAAMRLTRVRADRATSRADLECRLAAALTSPPRSELERLRAHTLDIIRAKKRLPPLHLVVGPAASAIPSGALTEWQRPDPRVIYHSFRRRGAAGSQSVSRQLVLLFLDDVLLHLFHSDTAPAQDDGQLAARQSALGNVLLRYSQRGYAVCLIDHLPSLHHAGKDEFRRVTAAIESLCTAHCATVDVTVVLSILSYVSATIGANASFVLPQCSGLLHFITSELNRSLPPDAASSIVVGTARRRAAFAAQQHAQFASNAHMRFLEIDEFLALLPP